MIVWLLDYFVKMNKLTKYLTDLATRKFCTKSDLRKGTYVRIHIAMEGGDEADDSDREWEAGSKFAGEERREYNVNKGNVCKPHSYGTNTRTQFLYRAFPSVTARRGCKTCASSCTKRFPGSFLSSRLSQLLGEFMSPRSRPYQGSLRSSSVKDRETKENRNKRA